MLKNWDPTSRTSLWWCHYLLKLKGKSWLSPKYKGMKVWECMLTKTWPCTLLVTSTVSVLDDLSVSTSWGALGDFHPSLWGSPTPPILPVFVSLVHSASLPTSPFCFQSLSRPGHAALGSQSSQWTPFVSRILTVRFSCITAVCLALLWSHSSIRFDEFERIQTLFCIYIAIWSQVTLWATF